MNVFPFIAWKELGSDHWVSHGVVLLEKRGIRYMLNGLTMTVWQ